MQLQESLQKIQQIAFNPIMDKMLSITGFSDPDEMTRELF